MNFTTHKTTVMQRGAMPARAYYLAGKKYDLKKWGFRYFDDEIAVEKALSCTPEREISVPSCWEILGYGKHQYTNVNYPFPFDPPLIERNNPCGVYVTKFTRPAREGKYYLNFEGVDSCFYLFVNGKEVGYSSVPHSPSEFDVTPFLADENELRVVVFKFSAGSYLEDQDKLRMSGIFRDVYLLHRPEGHLFDYTVRASYDEKTGKGALEVTCDRPCSFTLKAEGKTYRGKGESFKRTLPVCPWTAETPVLYPLTISCAGERIAEKVGFCTVKAEGNVLTLNGKPIKFRGVNRHSMTEKGYVETRADLERDLDLLKEMHCNAIRTSHYPPHPLLPKLCDERGFYLLEEADVESHGSVSATNVEDFEERRNLLPENPAYFGQFEGRALRMYERDKNRPSVLIWSLGNESGWGEGLARAARALKEKGDGRLLHYEGAYEHTGDRFVDGGLLDLYSRMYPELKWTEDFAKTADRPLVLCEYTHAMGNSCGDIAAYWELIRKYPALCGGFIWEWCSHSVLEGKKILYGGDFGEYPHDGNFCMDGVVTTDRKKNPEFWDVRRVYLPVKVVREGDELVLKNLLDFAPLSILESTAVLRYRRDDALFAGGEYDISALPAGGSLRVPLKEKEGYDYAELFLPHCGEVFQFPLPRKKEERKEKNGLLYKTENGLPVSLILGGKELLRAPAFMTVWRAPLDNDMNIKAEWLSYGLDRAYYYPLEGTEGGSRGKLVTPVLPPIGEAELHCHEEGGLAVGVKVRLSDHVKSLPRFGFVFDLALPADTPVSWYGLGPNEAYEDRNFSSYTALHSSRADSVRYEYPKPQESGSRCGTYFVALGEGIKLMIDSETPFSFCISPYLPADYRAHRHEMKDTGHLYLFLDYRMAGVGSNSCGPRIDEKYLITEREFTFRFRLRSANGLFEAHRSKQ